MAVPFLSSITLNKNEVQDFKVFNIGTGNPTLSSGGDIGYFWTDTTGSKVLKWWDGAAVRTILDSSSTTVVAADLSGGAAGSLPYQITAGDTTFLGIGTANQVLTVNTGATAPQWVNQSSLSVGSATTATTADKVANALTAGTYLTSGGTFDGSTARTFAVDATDANTASKVVARDGSGNFSAGTITASLSGNASTATNVSGGAAGQLLYQSGLATTAKLGVGTDGYILTYDGTNTKPKWSASIPSGSVSGLAASATTDTTNAANISSGTLSLSRLALASGNFYVGNGSNNPAATAKSSISLTGFGALTADLDIAGFNIINSGNVTSGSSGSTLATKGYVDSVAQGLDVKASCLVASTTNITLSSPGSITIDGVSSATFTSGTTRILVKDQSAPAENGIYIWNGTGSAMTRSLDANTWDELVGAFTFIEEGTANADSGWVCNVNSGGTLGTTAVTWTKFSQAGAYTAGNGMVLSGGAFSFATATPYTTGQIPYASSSSAIGFKSVTGTGDVVLATSPTLVTPALGTPTSGNLSSCTGLSLTTGVSGTLPVGNGGTGATTFTAGQVLFGNGTSAINSSSNLFWDNASSALGIGNNAPGSKLEVTGAIAAKFANPDVGGIILQATTGTNAAAMRFENTGGIAYVGLDSSTGSRIGGAAYSLNLWHEQARSIVFGTSNTFRMTLDSSGNLGLGAVSPSQRLFVQSASSPIAAFNSTSVSGPYLIFQSSGTSFGDIGSAKAITGSYNATDMALNARSAASMYFCISDVAKMVLDSSGNLGVGVTTVGERIHASGNIKAAGTAGTFPRFISEVGAKSWATGYRSGTTSFEIWEDSTTRLAIANGGQIQVGINGTTSAPAITLGANTDTGIYWPTNFDTLALAVGGSDAVYIDSSRNVGIGLTPSVKTHIAASGPTRGVITKIQNSSSGTTGAFQSIVAVGAQVWSYGLPSGSADFAFYSGRDESADGTERFRIKNTGQINLVGLAADPTGAAGDLYYSTGNVLKMHNGTAWQQLSRKFSGALSGTGTSFTVTHNLGTRDVTVQVRKSGSTYDLVYTDVQMTTTDTVTVIFASSVTGSDYTVTVIG